MGTELMDERLIPEVPWLNAATNRYLRRLIALAVSTNPDVQAVILYGSAARQELRPLTDPEPSDVDLLFLMIGRGVGAEDGGGSRASRDNGGAADGVARRRRISGEQHLAISRAEVAAYPEEMIDPEIRPVQTMIADPAFAGWDRSFVENVARDGLLLWARDSGSLPEALTPIVQRPLAALGHPPPRETPAA